MAKGTYSTESGLPDNLDIFQESESTSFGFHFSYCTVKYKHVSVKFHKIDYE